MTEQELYKERLTELLDLLESNGLKPFLLCGTLFAAYRDGKPFGNDYKDIDIAVCENDYWKFREIIDKSKDFSYYRVWTKEIALLYKSRKIDIFFIDPVGENTHIYSYKKNSFTGKWDTEWRSVFETKDFFPLKKWKYKWLEREVYIPNNVENILSTHYGNWKVPEPDWTIDRMTNVDNNYREILFLVRKSTDKNYNECIQSIKTTYPEDWYNIKSFSDSIDVECSYVIVVSDLVRVNKLTKIDDAIQILLDKENNGIVGRCYDRKDLNWFTTFSGRTQKPLEYYLKNVNQDFIIIKKDCFNKNVPYRIVGTKSLIFDKVKK